MPKCVVVVVEIDLATYCRTFYDDDWTKMPDRKVFPDVSASGRLRVIKQTKSIQNSLERVDGFVDFRLEFQWWPDMTEVVLTMLSNSSARQPVAILYLNTISKALIRNTLQTKVFD